MAKARRTRTTTLIPIRHRERGGAFTQGLNGSGIRRRAPGANSSSVLRVRSSISLTSSLASIRPIPPFQPIWIYKVPKDGPPNEYSLMHCLGGDRSSRGALAITAISHDLSINSAAKPMRCQNNSAMRANLVQRGRALLLRWMDARSPSLLDALHHDI